MITELGDEEYIQLSHNFSDFNKLQRCLLCFHGIVMWISSIYVCDPVKSRKTRMSVICHNFDMLANWSYTRSRAVKTIWYQQSCHPGITLWLSNMRQWLYALMNWVLFFSYDEKEFFRWSEYLLKLFQFFSDVSFNWGSTFISKIMLQIPYPMQQGTPVQNICRVCWCQVVSSYTVPFIRISKSNSSLEYRISGSST